MGRRSNVARPGGDLLDRDRTTHGRPHVTPLLSVWHDAALYFCTGPGEQKAKNLARNPHCNLLTGCNSRDDGLDIVLEGDAERVTDDQLLRQIAASYLSKYGNEWRFTVHDGGLTHASESLREADTGVAVVYEVAPNTAFAFHKGTHVQPNTVSVQRMIRWRAIPRRQRWYATTSSSCTRGSTSSAVCWTSHRVCAARFLAHALS